MMSLLSRTLVVSCVIVAQLAIIGYGQYTGYGQQNTGASESYSPPGAPMQQYSSSGYEGFGDPVSQQTESSYPQQQQQETAYPYGSYGMNSQSFNGNGNSPFALPSNPSAGNGAGRMHSFATTNQASSSSNGQPQPQAQPAYTPYSPPEATNTGGAFGPDSGNQQQNLPNTASIWQPQTATGAGAGAANVQGSSTTGNAQQYGAGMGNGNSIGVAMPEQSNFSGQNSAAQSWSTVQQAGANIQGQGQQTGPSNQAMPWQSNGNSAAAVWPLPGMTGMNKGIQAGQLAGQGIRAGQMMGQGAHAGQLPGQGLQAGQGMQAAGHFPGQGAQAGQILGQGAQAQSGQMLSGGFHTPGVNPTPGGQAAPIDPMFGQPAARPGGQMAQTNGNFGGFVGGNGAYPNPAGNSAAAQAQFQAVQTPDWQNNAAASQQQTQSYGATGNSQFGASTGTSSFQNVTAQTPDGKPMPISTMLTKQIQQLPAVMYLDSSNTQQKQIETLLRDTYHLPLVAFYVDKLGNRAQVVQALQQLTAYDQLPYVFICSKFIGSQKHIEEYQRNSQMAELIKGVCKGANNSSS